jgi:hypothetical protein
VFLILSVMAHYRHLPVWKAALDLAVHLEHAVRRFGKTPSPPRYHKYTLGSELRQTVQHLRASGIGHQVVSQSGHFKTGFKHRTLTGVWWPTAAKPLPIKPNNQPQRA